MVVGEWPFLGCEFLLFWLRNRLFLVAESSFFGCGIAFFWLRKRLFLVAEACLILVAESPKFGCGSVEIWFRNRNLFKEKTGRETQRLHLPVKTQCFVQLGISCELGNRKRGTGDRQEAYTCEKPMFCAVWNNCLMPFKSQNALVRARQTTFS